MSQLVKYPKLSKLQILAGVVTVAALGGVLLHLGSSTDEKLLSQPAEIVSEAEAQPVEELIKEIWMIVPDSPAGICSQHIGQGTIDGCLDRDGAYKLNPDRTAPLDLQKAIQVDWSKTSPASENSANNYQPASVSGGVIVAPIPLPRLTAGQWIVVMAFCIGIWWFGWGMGR